jgi:cellulose synthase/poly-beta-1,6-N-acetylglucosamine synthase-like glycosyltransferase
MDLSQLNTWTVIAWAIATVWVAIIIVFTKASWQQASLVPMDASPDPVEGPKLSVLVAARNETKCIETCIRSLFRQDYPDLEVVAINDRSSDDTAQILDRLEVEFSGRLKVIHVTHLPSGWFGKPNALTLGLQNASGSVICFTDADCVFEAPTALRTTVAELFRRDLDFFSLAARYSMNSLREAVAVPCCSEALMTWLRPERIEDPRWSDAFANGAFIMVRKAPFDRIGGWGAVRTQISEDLQLARLAKRQGLRVGVAHGKGFYQTGSYPTVRESWNGWSRIFKGTLTPAQLMITVGRMSILFLMPLIAVLSGLLEGFRTGNFEWLTYGTGLGFFIAFALRCTLDLSVFRLVGAPILAVPLAPLGRLYVMAATTRALLSHAGLVGTHWRGATFVAGQLVMAKQAKPEPQIP